MPLPKHFGGLNLSEVHGRARSSCQSFRSRTLDRTDLDWLAFVQRLLIRTVSQAEFRARYLRSLTVEVAKMIVLLDRARLLTIQRHTPKRTFGPWDVSPQPMLRVGILISSRLDSELTQNNQNRISPPRHSVARPCIIGFRPARSRSLSVNVRRLATTQLQ